MYGYFFNVSVHFTYMLCVYVMLYACYVQAMLCYVCMWFMHVCRIRVLCYVRYVVDVC